MQLRENLLFSALSIVPATASAQPGSPPSEFRVRCENVCLKQFAERYLVIDGKIRQIEATVLQVPYKMDPGWPAE